MRDAQLLWIPSAGLEALAAHSPRAFVSLAWRMGSRARGRSGSSSSPGGALFVQLGAALALDEFVGAVHAALSRTCAARVADSALRLAEVGQAGVGPLANEATAHW